MGSLSNLYISQSYISLIHLGSNNTASSTPTELQDGLGNGVGVSVSTNGNLYVSGNVYATNLTGSGGTIDTSSLVTTASFNAYTASQDFKNTTFATTASNTFTGNQTILGNLNITPVAISDNPPIGTQKYIIPFISGSTVSKDAGDSLYWVPTSNLLGISSSAGTSTIQPNSIGTVSGSRSGLLSTTQIVSQVESGKYIAISGDPSKIGSPSLATSTQPSIILQSGSNFYIGIEFQSSASYTDGRVTVLTPLSASAGFTASLQNGYAWVGNGNNENTQVATSSFGSTINTGSLVTTASFNAYTQSTNTFTASISTSVGLLQTFSSSEYKADSASFDTRINSAGGQLQILDEGNIQGNATSLNFIGDGVSVSITSNTASVTISGGSINTGSFATTGSNTFTGIQTLSDVDLLNQIGLDDHSGSLVLFAKGFTSSSLTHISASSAGIGNIIFKTNNNTATTIVSGSSNILTNAAAATAGFNRYIGGSGNIMLNGSNVPQISSSMTISPTMNNNYFGGNSTTLLMRGPVSSSAWTISGNSILGTVNIGPGGANAQGIVSGLTMTGNEIQGTLALTANKANLSSSLSFTNNILNGVLSLNVNSSSVAMSSNNINDLNLTLNNNFFSSSAGVGSVTIGGNNIGGASNTITIQGTQPVGTTNGIFLNANTILGGVNTLFVDPTNRTVSGTNAYHSAVRNIIGGNNLIISASSLSTDNNSLGSAYFGRYNANDGIRNKTSEIVFAVGTGNSTTRKTGFLIDSGSNAFIEGTLNVSGSSSLTGSLTVTSSNLNINSSGEITASKILLTDSGVTAIQYNQQSTGSVAGVFNTSYGKDNLRVYQYQGQPYAFNVNLTANQANAYTGSEFNWGLQVNGSNVSLPGGGGTYFSMVSGSNTGSAGDPGATKKGLDFLGTAMILDMNADTSFRSKVYVDQGMFVSQSAGGSQTPALTVDGTSAANNRAIVATGSVAITGSLRVNGSNVAIVGSNTFTQNQIVSASIYIAPNQDNNQLYLPSGSNKQTGLATLDGGNPGTVTVSNTNVTANSIIMLTKQTNNHPNAGPVNVSSKGSGTFTITSNHNSDNDVVAFMIINPS